MISQPPATIVHAKAPLLPATEGVSSTSSNANSWGLTSLTTLARGLEGLGLASSWTWTTERCSKVKVATKTVVNDDIPEPLKPVVPEAEERDDWADEHFASLENMAQGLAATAEAVEPVQVIHPPLPAPVVPPLLLPAGPCVSTEHDVHEMHTQKESNHTQLESIDCAESELP